MKDSLEKVREEKAITLASLTIMIIILLLIASISINAGTTSIKYTKFMRAKAQMETMQAQVNSWYQNDDDYGEEISSVSTYSNAFFAAGETETEGYKFFSAEYLNGLGLEEIKYDYLINISKRKVILAEGIEYEGDTYYTAEDFGIQNVDYVSINAIDFELVYEEDSSDSSKLYIYLYDIKFTDELGEEVDVSKFKVETKKDSNTYWTEHDVTETVYNNDDTKTYYRITVDVGTEYKVRISIDNGKISEEKDLTIEEE